MNRKELIRIIHVAKRDLCLDNETYRSLLLSHGGKESTLEMSDAALHRVFSAMKKMGFKVKSKPAPNKPKSSIERQISMIRGLWLELADIGEVRDRSDRAMNAFVHKCTDIGRVEWISSAQASAVIERLKKWRNRIA